MIQRQAQAILPQRQFAFAHILPRDEALAVFGWRDAAVFIKGGDQILVFLKAAAVANLRDRGAGIAQQGAGFI
ncbi:Uncharacterised protein [Klebsiella michiganensis]|uniref:Uncharacterized protein n=1 Tax=Klebsiella michiganensis TaxID=1134687 RepID=A0A7H4NKW4_9ENTR|nr:Uncharacterised protein [Klebsiella michiganensis]STV91166.1 Uncharacterised protein [Klebsiella michiganensis]